MAEQSKISCLVLAAGFSRRMGKPKLALPLGNSTVLEQSLSAARATPFLERILVVRESAGATPGFRSLEIGAEAEKGIHRSIRAGIEALSPCEAVCIALADQPFLTAQDFQDLLQAWAAAKIAGKDLLFPQHQGQRGNPAIVAARYFGEILEEVDTDKGCQYLFRRYPERVFAWDASARGFYQDLDDWETYQACRN